MIIDILVHLGGAIVGILGIAGIIYGIFMDDRWYNKLTGLIAGICLILVALKVYGFIQ
jgi:hypothetical protein